MRAHFPEAYHGDNGTRMMYRASHLYLLLSGLLNTALGLYLAGRMGWQGVLQGIGSVLILAGTLFLAIAFFHEPATGVIHRPVTFPAMLSLLSGMTAHTVASLKK